MSCCRQFLTRAFETRSARTRFWEMLSTARSFDIDDDDRFCDVVQVEQPGNTAEASIIVYTAHTTAETTVTSEKNSAQKSKLKERTPSSIWGWGNATIIRFVSTKFGVRTNSKSARRLNPVSTFNKWHGILVRLTMFLKESKSRDVIVIKRKTGTLFTLKVTTISNLHQIFVRLRVP